MINIVASTCVPEDMRKDTCGLVLQSFAGRMQPFLIEGEVNKLKKFIGGQANKQFERRANPLVVCQISQEDRII